MITKLNKIKHILFVSFRRVVYLLILVVARFFKDEEKKVVVLCYHGVDKKNWYHNVRPKMFLKQIEYLEKNFLPISPNTLLSIVRGEKQIDKNYFLVTFDDAYQEIVELEKYFKEKKYRPIIFALAEPKKVNRFEIDNEKKLMSDEELLKLVRSGWYLGSHSLTHSDMLKLNEKELDFEVLESKKILEEKFQTKVNYFSYPKGSYNKGIASKVKQAGYEMAFTMDDEVLKSPMNPFLIPRNGINYSLNMLEYKSSLLVFNVRLRKIIKNIFNLI